MPPRRQRHTVLSGTDWDLVTELFDRCRSLSPQEREKLLRRETKGREDIEAEVLSLLEASPGGESFERPLASGLFKESGGVATPPPPPANGPFRPRRMGKFLLLEKLGEGGMAEVYLATAKGAAGFQKLLAVKRVLPSYLGNTDTRKMLEYEARLSSHLAHANIVHVYDLVQHEKEFLLSMELVRGKNLLQVIDAAKRVRIRMPRDCALFVALEVARGLAYAHEKTDPRTGEKLRIVHRDISPKNIMIGYDGSVKIVDFGIAKARDRAKLTRSGQFRGTIDYMAPELFANEPASQQSDLFSLSVVLYEMLSGEPLFGGDNILAVMQQIQDDTLPSHRVEALDVQPEIQEILRRGLAKEPDERFHSAQELATLLQEFIFRQYSAMAQQHLAEFMVTLFAKDIRKEDERLARAIRASEIPGMDRETSTIEIERKPEEEASIREVVTEPMPRRGTGLRGLLLAGLLVASVFLGLRLRVEVPDLGFSPAEPRAPAAAEANSAAVEAPPIAPIAPIAPTAQPAPEVIPTIAVQPTSAVPEKLDPSAIGAKGCSALIESVPTGALVLMNGILVGTSPATVPLQCGAEMKIALEKDGFRRLEQRVIFRKKQSSLTLTLTPLASP